MADLAQRIEKLEKQLEDQRKEVQAAKEVAAGEKQAWQRAEKVKASKRAFWEDSVKQLEAERKAEQQLAQRLQTLFKIEALSLKGSVTGMILFHRSKKIILGSYYPSHRPICIERCVCLEAI